MPYFLFKSAKDKMQTRIDDIKSREDELQSEQNYLGIKIDILQIGKDHLYTA